MPVQCHHGLVIFGWAIIIYGGATGTPISRVIGLHHVLGAATYLAIGTGVAKVMYGKKDIGVDNYVLKLLVKAFVPFGKCFLVLAKVSHYAQYTSGIITGNRH
jgi:hypothetical protein